MKKCENKNGEHSPPDPPLKNIILIGFMGCGKSTLGRELHKSLGYPFIDTDAAIEEKTGKKISEIFKKHGEDTFRTLETELLEKLLKEKHNHAIIATGGGIITRKENIILLKKLGFVVWLTCSPDIIYERTSRNSNRPLLQCENPKEAIASLIKERGALYQSASHLKIDTSHLDIPEITCGILESARYHFS